MVGGLHWIPACAGMVMVRGLHWIPASCLRRNGNSTGAALDSGLRRNDVLKSEFMLIHLWLEIGY